VADAEIKHRWGQPEDNSNGIERESGNEPLQGGNAGVLGDSEDNGRKRALHDAERIVSTQGAGPTNGFWADAEWLPCRDGKARPVEPGTFPLVDGASARVGRLRGYGNAIVAPAAEAFIRAYMGTL
jgi:DNA (cytosine-5)-methyltransferase 1